jgi:large subunit ribosomal protein L7/L12
MARYDTEIQELRQRVFKLEQQIEFILRSQGLRYHDEPNQGISPSIMAALQCGNKIKAIKIYREETGVGLKEAKDFIDSLGY